MKNKTKRLFLLIIAITILTIAITLMLVGLKDNIIFFYSPSQIITEPNNPKFQKKFRIGGLIKKNSIKQNTNKINFIITDEINNIEISYKGILPDLFREGQGIVAIGKLNDEKIFIATKLLAKHDENYMPQEAVQALKEAGRWKGQ